MESPPWSQSAASPFPSPSSSFLSPPVLAAHEFAIRAPEPASDVETEPHSIATPTSNQQLHPLEMHPPTTPTQTSPFSPNSPSLSSMRPAPLSPAASRRTSTISARSSSKSAASNSSDPLSGSSSRRQSKRSSSGLGGLSLILSSPPGAGAGIRQSMLSALNTDSRVQNEGDDDVAANIKTPTATTSSPSVARTATPIPATDLINPAPHQSATSPRKHRRSTKIKIHIRDFAFEKPDDRYRGVGSDVPKPNRFARLNKKLGGSKKVRPSSNRWSTASESTGVAGSDSGGGGGAKEGKERRGFFHTKFFDDEDEDDEDDEDDDDDDADGDNDGWFKRGMGRFSWAFGLSNSKKQVQPEEERSRKEAVISADNDSYPSRDEMDFNFGGISDPDDVGDSEHQVEEEELLLPGEYRAVFAFEPEGTAEMRLIEDQVVQVVGRGGGVGWAVVIVPEGVEGGVEVAPGIRHALVPESYLEAINLN